MGKSIRVWVGLRKTMRWIVIDENEVSVEPHSDMFGRRAPQWAVLDGLMHDDKYLTRPVDPQCKCYTIPLDLYLEACKAYGITPFPVSQVVTTKKVKP